MSGKGPIQVWPQCITTQYKEWPFFLLPSRSEVPSVMDQKQNVQSFVLPRTRRYLKQQGQKTFCSQFHCGDWQSGLGPKLPQPTQRETFQGVSPGQDLRGCLCSSRHIFHLLPLCLLPKAENISLVGQLQKCLTFDCFIFTAHSEAGWEKFSSIQVAQKCSCHVHH